MKKLFSAPECREVVREVWALGPHRVRLMTKHAANGCNVFLHAWQGGWRKVLSHGTPGGDEAPWNDARTCLEQYRSGLLEKAVMFLDGHTNDGPG